MVGGEKMKKEKSVQALKHRRTKRCRGDVIFDTVTFIILTVVLLIVAYPLYWVVISSISNPSAVSSGEVLWRPIGFTLKGYSEVFKNKAVMGGFMNSIIYTVCGVLVNLAVTLPTAYALSRNNFSGKKPITIFYMITMFFGGGMIPTYLVVKNLHLLNTMWALFLPGCLSVYNMIVARTFFQSNISEELYEAAEIDGCTQGKFFFKIALPLSKAIIAILVLYYGVGHWNSYFSALLYISDKERYPLQLVLRNILITNEAALSQSASTEAARAALREKQQLMDVMKYSLMIISSIPMLAIYPFIQKHFVKGVMIGSIKG
jgi:putative aldouronate transport system permease protein